MVIYNFIRNQNSYQLSVEVVGGNFYCYNNELTTLKGSPKEVGIGFFCTNNKLTTLEGGPKEVGGAFGCSINKLTSLEGCPEVVGDIFDCTDNKLNSLKYMPAIRRICYTDFSADEVKVEQDIMKQAKTYEEGGETYQDYIDIFGDE